MILRHGAGLPALPEGAASEAQALHLHALVEHARLALRGGVVLTFGEWSTLDPFERFAYLAAHHAVAIEAVLRARGERVDSRDRDNVVLAAALRHVTDGLLRRAR